MHEPKTFRSFFKKKEKRQSEIKSPMFKSPSHYWTASSTGFLHSKGSANVELSVDPFNKSLIRIFCQSVDKMVNYKSMDYSARTTVYQVIDKMIKVLRLDKSIDEFVLCEVVGRSMALDSDGATKKKIAKRGEPSIFLEQNRRVLMHTDYILTVLNYWKPMYGFSRRFDICLASKENRMTACDGSELTDEFGFFPGHDSDMLRQTRGSLSTQYVADTENKCIQTDLLTTSPKVPPTVPRRNMSSKLQLKQPQFILLKGDNKETPPTFNIEDKLEFGTTGSNCRFVLTRVSNLPNQLVLLATKELCDRSSGRGSAYKVWVESVAQLMELPVLVNGVQIRKKMALQCGDIIDIGKEYTFFFKDPAAVDDATRVNHYLNSGTVGAVDKTDHHPESASSVMSSSSDVSDVNVTSNSLSSCNEVPHSATRPQNPQLLVTTSTSSSAITATRRLQKIDLSGINIKCFDTALNQVLIHFFKDRMDLVYSSAFVLYLVRFCRESSRCSFTLDEMHEQMKKRISRALEVAYEEDYYFLANMKMVSLLYQLWLVYHYDQNGQDDPENRDWLLFLETFVGSLFEQLVNYVCEQCADMSMCVFEEMPLLTLEEQRRQGDRDDLRTMERMLTFLEGIYRDVEALVEPGTVLALKKVLTSRIVTYITEAITATLLSDMDGYTWHKGLQLLTQIEKLENWFKVAGVSKLYEADGFLSDMGKLISLRDKTLKEMDWVSIRKHHQRIPLCVLRQFLLSVSKNDSTAVRMWHPPQAEIKEACYDVNFVLQQYLHSAEASTLFHPGIVLQTDCLPIDKILDSVDFVSLATVMDTELSGMAETFRWMALTRPHSLVAFRSSCWVNGTRHPPSLIGAHGSSHLGGGDGLNLVAPARKTIDRLKKRSQNDSDYSSASQRMLQPRFSLATVGYDDRRQRASSKSMVALNGPLCADDHRDGGRHGLDTLAVLTTVADTPVVPDRRHRAPSSGQASAKSVSATMAAVAVAKGGSNNNSSMLGRWGSMAAGIGHHNAASSSYHSNSGGHHGNGQARSDTSDDVVLDVDKSIEQMSRMIELEDGGRSGVDVDDDDEMSVGLSAAGLTNKMRGSARVLRSSDEGDDDVEVDGNATLEVTLEKLQNESYGITIVDGMQTELRSEGIFVLKLNRGGPAYKSGQIRPGDKIVSINDYSVEQLSFKDCMLLITKSMTKVKLLLEKANLQTAIKMMSVYQ